MKRITRILCVCSISLATFGSHAQVFNEGDIGVEVYYGTPTLFQRFAKAVFEIDSLSVNNINVSNAGPVGIRGEYMVSQKFGLGIDFGFNNIRVTADRTESVYNSSTDTYNDVVYQDQLNTTKFGGMVTFNYHFLEEERLDLAVTGGVGYGYRTFSVSSTQPEFDDKKYSIGTIVWPLALRVGFVGRYYFTPNIGLNLGLGLGHGGIMNGGVSFKF